MGQPQRMAKTGTGSGHFLQSRAPFRGTQSRLQSQLDEPEEMASGLWQMHQLPAPALCPFSSQILLPSKPLVSVSVRNKRGMFCGAKWVGFESQVQLFLAEPT